LPLRRVAIGVAVVFHAGAASDDATEQLTRLAGVAREAEPVRTAGDLAAREIETREPDVVLEERVRLPDRADPPVDVLQRDVPLRGAVHLDDPRDAEALLE